MGKVSEKAGVQQLVESFYNHGVKYIVFSPGSRNAPLVVSFANDERFKCFVIPDERSAAFYALGMAEQSGTPVPVMCTSGSALLNYYPAVSEAFYRNIPLIVVSADRPSEWTDHGDGQTIRQENVFQNHICAYTQLYETPNTEDQKWFNKRTMDEVLIQAKSPQGGPVHFNFPFTEPLYALEDKSAHEKKQDNFLEVMKLSPQLSSVQKAELQETWNNSSRKLILCGQMPKNGYLNEQLKQLANDKSVAVVVENTSNLQDRGFIHCIDRTISSFLEDNPELYQPDLLITIGGAVISKKIKKYLRQYKPKNHWKIGQEFPFMDTYQSLKKSIPMDANSFMDFLLEEGFNRNNSRYGEQWKQLDYLAQGNHEDYLMSVPYSDLSVFNLVLDAIPDHSNLHLGNSSVVRYAQLFDPIKSINYFCNRGTSGIDGSTSTAIGNTLAGEDKLHTLITGDISFFYDSNAFWNHHVPSNFRVFLINNGGGGIFNIIPGPRSSAQGEEFFVAKHSFSAKSIAEAFNVNYFQATSMEEIDNQLDVFMEIQDNDRPAIMEVFTDGEASGKILLDYLEKTKVKDVPELEN
ncbi:2-succinyl-5-enolpyruvyl-6-hydroxy-3-cyclohexene-1-carboxylic-acid synthase [Brumimicrobium salinarum]|uniref:2-succinyl-5-enolpyruvyl-6-hydroxy-3-cyclohexene-1-carboxylate synthase n=1 Tax=Brumimicrobium salinarum TaxID=2058658 RepID=A0A2I0R1C2_9FLAO|nr:2-succinyl-5-enolpyruvyl-6-hydroxy-3-cyclohexene-1-carboxylic-acid synthase [Brumimicrobium salinarum]PKR80345.1 2-succinyl-5-enolpyruvyl-6-hydroxy-3-cyclohexene-1-carboxylic-acid synthase [Brumimicrobium salinarum]